MPEPAVPPLRPTVDAARFQDLDLRAGTVLECAPLPGARLPAYRLRIDLGPLGVVRSAARLVDNYGAEELVGSQVICAANLPPRQVGVVRSEVLVLGVYEHGTGRVVLLRPDRRVADGDQVG